MIERRLRMRLVIFCIVSTLTLITLGGECNGEEWQRIRGRLGASRQYGSGWLDLAATTSFTKGERLRLSVGGTAMKVVIRLLLISVFYSGPVRHFVLAHL